MQTKDVTKMLNIPRERIRYYREKNVFVPELISEKGKPRKYTERDLINLKRLEVLTKAGLSCDYIKKVQTGAITLKAAFEERNIHNRKVIAEKQGALSLSAWLEEAGIDYQAAGEYWETVHQRELGGEQFDAPDIDHQTIALDRLVKCPNCGEYHSIDFEDFITDSISNASARDDDMGADTMYYFDTEDALACSTCGCRFRVKGWVREYPIGAYDSESIEITVEESEENSR